VTHSEQVRQYFDRHAARYDNPFTTFIGIHELRAIQKRVPPGSTVLDYGCGTGRTTLDLLQRDCKVTAYDISVEMLGIAKARATQLEYLAEFTTDIEMLSGRSWPLVTCIGVLDYYSDPSPLLKRLSTYLAVDGRLVVTYPNGLSPLGWAYTLGSIFRMRVFARTPDFVQQAAMQANLKVSHLCFAFPGSPYLGLTLVVEMVRH
jgi:2-polyprenyl-3-methyl-5-hydroxy-6-metoxy-1,4-benzoquinol methylase